MREYSNRSSQLKAFRKRLLIREVFLSILLIGIIITLTVLFLRGYVLYNDGDEALTWLYQNFILVVVITLSIIILLGIPSFLIITRTCKNANRVFHKKYLDYMFEECHLNEVNYSFRKKTLDKEVIDEIAHVLAVKQIERIFSIVDVGPERVMEYMQCSYLKDNKKYQGVVMLLKNENFLPGFVQIRSRGEPLKTEYEGKSIVRFGFNKRNNLSLFEVFSSLGSSTYQLENNNFSSSVGKLVDFVKCEMVITRFEGYVLIFLESFQFNLTSSIFAKFRKIDFETKVDALLHLHELTDEVVKGLLSLKA